MTEYAMRADEMVKKLEALPPKEAERIWDMVAGALALAQYREENADTEPPRTA